MPFIDDELLWCPDNDGKMVDLSQCLQEAANGRPDANGSPGLGELPQPDLLGLVSAFDRLEEDEEDLLQQLGEPAFELDDNFFKAFEEKEENNNNVVSGNASSEGSSSNGTNNALQLTKSASSAMSQEARSSSAAAVAAAVRKYNIAAANPLLAEKLAAPPPAVSNSNSGSSHINSLGGSSTTTSSSMSSASVSIISRASIKTECLPINKGVWRLSDGHAKQQPD